MEDLPSTPVLDRIRVPSDLRLLSSPGLQRLAEEIRRFLLVTVSRTGGHLGPNLGVVELTLALHRVFDSPRDRILWDTGHQAYVHKMLTGRQDDFATLRQPGGLSGYPSRTESVHDVIENSHASTALSYADGLATAYALRGERDRAAVEGALRRAARFGGPVLVHCVTRKGFGYAPAEDDDADCLHGPGAFDPRTGRLLAEETETWTSVVGDELVALAADDPTLVAIT